MWAFWGVGWIGILGGASKYQGRDHNPFAKQDPSDEGYYCDMLKDEEESWQCGSVSRVLAYTHKDLSLVPRTVILHACNPTT